MNSTAMCKYNFRDVLLFSLLLFSILLTTEGTAGGQDAGGLRVQLVDAAQQPVTEYYLSNPPDNEIYVLVTGSSDRTTTTSCIINITPAPNVDTETITLYQPLYHEGTGTYFGPDGGLTIFFGLPAPGNNIAEARAGQQIVANCAESLQSTPANVKKYPTASVTSLLNSAGAPKTYYFIGTESIYLRVSDEDRNGQPDAADTIHADLTTDGGDNETLTLTETGSNTGIFAGSIASASGAVDIGSGTIEATINDILTATYTDDNDTADVTSDTAHFTASKTTLTNSSGTEHDPFLINSELIFITVTDLDQNIDHTVQETVIVNLINLTTLDTILNISLTEIAANMGIFRNTIGIPSQIDTATADDILQTENCSTIRAYYTDASDETDSSSDIARTADEFTPICPDFNADNHVDLADVIVGLQVLVGEAVWVDKKADIDGDGQIGMVDVLYSLHLSCEL